VCWERVEEMMIGDSVHVVFLLSAIASGVMVIFVCLLILIWQLDKLLKSKAVK